MSKIAINFPYNVIKEQLLNSTKSLVHDIYKSLLRRDSLKEDALRFTNLINTENNSITDIYFDNKKVGSLATSFILGGPGGINLEYTPTLSKVD